MRRALRHRGPLGESHLELANCVLGHNRLRDMDRGPVTDATRRLSLVMDGELYPMGAQSPTEAMLTLYESHGEDAPLHARGKFAFAVWDAARNTLFAARDRFGEKPLFYALTADGALVFGSEIKAILASGLIEPRIDPGRIAYYLNKSYSHPTRTIYENVHVLPPAHCLTFRDGALQVRRYWNFPATRPDISLEQAIEAMRPLLSRAVASQLAGDVPVAAFLSGGHDSSTIAMEASRTRPGITTLAYHFDDELDESPYSRAVARQLGTRHIEMRAQEGDIAELLQRMAQLYDEPFADSSNIPTYLICQHAKEHAGAVLTGDGAEETFGGSLYQFLATFADNMGRPDIEVLLKFLALGSIRKLFRATNRYIGPRVNGLKYKRKFDALPEALDYGLSFFAASELAAYGLTRDDPPFDFAREGNLNDALKADILLSLPGDILLKTDRASMAWGLELRSPFLDAELSQFMISLPARLKVTAREDKILLRRAFENQWPESLRKRSKQGFGGPVQRWLRQPRVMQLMQDAFAPTSPLYDHVPRELVARHREGSHEKTWLLLNLAVWLMSLEGRRS